MPILNISNSHILYSPADAVNGDTGSSDPAPTGVPGYDPELQQLINGLSGLDQPRKPADPAAPVTASSVATVFSPFQEETPLAPAQVAAGAFAGAVAPLSPPDADSTDPAPTGVPGYDPELQQLINGLSGLDQPRNNAAPSAPVTASSVASVFSPFQQQTPLAPAQVEAGAFAGALSPLSPPDADSTDPAPTGVPGCDPELQQFINELSGLSQPSNPPAEPIQTSKYISHHHVRIDP